jgi:hypothetical protein
VSASRTTSAFLFLTAAQKRPGVFIIDRSLYRGRAARRGKAGCALSPLVGVLHTQLTGRWMQKGERRERVMLRLRQGVFPVRRSRLSTPGGTKTSGWLGFNFFFVLVLSDSSPTSDVCFPPICFPFLSCVKDFCLFLFRHSPVVHLLFSSVRNYGNETHPDDVPVYMRQFCVHLPSTSSSI